MSEQQAERIDLEESDLAAARAGNWRRRFEAEAERAEMLEAAFAGARRDLAAARQQVADRDGEIDVLRERLAALTGDDEAAPPTDPPQPDDDGAAPPAD